MVNDILNIIGVVEDINEKIINSFPDSEGGGNDELGFYPSISLTIVRDFIILKFEDTIIWSNEEDTREFNEETNEYEPLEPFLIKEINKILDTYKQIKI